VVKQIYLFQFKIFNIIARKQNKFSCVVRGATSFAGRGKDTLSALLGGSLLNCIFEIIKLAIEEYEE